MSLITKTQKPIEIGADRVAAWQPAAEESDAAKFKALMNDDSAYAQYLKNVALPEKQQNEGDAHYEWRAAQKDLLGSVRLLQSLAMMPNAYEVLRYHNAALIERIKKMRHDEKQPIDLASYRSGNKAEDSSALVESKSETATETQLAANIASMNSIHKKAEEMLTLTEKFYNDAITYVRAPAYSYDASGTFELAHMVYLREFANCCYDISDALNTSDINLSKPYSRFITDSLIPHIESISEQLEQMVARAKKEKVVQGKHVNSGKKGLRMTAEEVSVAVADPDNKNVVSLFSRNRGE